MENLEKLLEYVIWFIVISGIIWFLYGIVQLVNLLFIRGKLW